MSKVDKFTDFHPLSRQQWRAWLEENHDRLEGVWFVYYKKSAGKPRVGYDEAVEEALCFGWIDSLPRKLDEERSKLLFTPRKARSVWSKLNKERVEKLIENNLMTEIGLKKIEAAKKDGSWDALNASDNLEIAEDLQKAFSENKKAILYWINSAKREETRRARIEKTISMAARNKRAQFDKED